MNISTKYHLKNLSAIFITGFIQVFFVAVNTVFLARSKYVGVLFASFAISFIWSFNVKKVAFGTMADRITYAAGAAAGSLFGLWASSFISEIIKSI